MPKYKIEHDRPNCIGCSACVGVDPETWEMGEDGKSNLKGGTNREDGWEEKGIEEELHAKATEAADACPVNVIHVKNLEEPESSEAVPEEKKPDEATMESKPEEENKQS